MGQNDKWMGQNDKWMRQNDKWTGQKTGQNDNEIASASVRSTDLFCPYAKQTYWY